MTQHAKGKHLVELEKQVAEVMGAMTMAISYLREHVMDHEERIKALEPKEEDDTERAGSEPE